MLRLTMQLFTLLLSAIFVGQASMLGAPGPITQTRSQGVFVGNRLSTLHVDEYLSIPFAEAPIGNLRFAKPRAPSPYFGKQLRSATQPGAICIQPSSPHNSIAQIQSEDCLHLNIYKPSTIAAGRKVPVMVWLYGGSWQEGSIHQARINATHFVARSMALDEPVIFVSANYRVGAFGFLAGQAVVDGEQDGSTVLNAGMWDQRAALQWVQANIGSFGGDASRVTLFGESAGATNVGNHIMADDGKASAGLFRAAILQSGNAATGHRLPATHPDVETTYGHILQGAGCSKLASNAEQIACLKTRNTTELTAGNNMAIANAYIAYMPVQDNYFIQQLPSKQWSTAGGYMRVPFITGTNLDEGTEFPYPTTVHDDQAFERAQLFAIGAHIEPILAGVLQTWSADPSLGSPFRADFFGLSADDTYYPLNGTNQYKRQASMCQDVFFEAGRSLQLQAARRDGVPAWAYRFAQPSPVGLDRNGLAKASMGVQHEAEIPFVFANPPVQGAGSVDVPEPLRTFASDDKLVRVSDAMSAAWVHFAYNMNPNGAEVPAWEQYSDRLDAHGNGHELYLQADNMNMVADDTHTEQVKFVAQQNEYFFI